MKDTLEKIIEDFAKEGYETFLVEDNRIIFSTQPKDDKGDFWKGYRELYWYYIYLEIGEDYCSKFAIYEKGDEYMDIPLDVRTTFYEDDIYKSEIELISRLWKMGDFKECLKQLKKQ